MLITLKLQFTNWKLIAHVMTTLGSLSAIASLASFGPSIVASYGYKAIEANAMNSIGYWILIPVTLFWGWAAYVSPATHVLTVIG